MQTSEAPELSEEPRLLLFIVNLPVHFYSDVFFSLPLSSIALFMNSVFEVVHFSALTKLLKAAACRVHEEN